ncbi:MAG: hypothetical protein M1478_04550 [Deltaproteobacteria bacterium]|jgi:hypothetical protein|nr:hypothetical protein [Deltaproteobacteria bacterium]MCL5880085.1 hypothetical protein [Deltaproteobacteria bacterium]
MKTEVKHNGFEEESYRVIIRADNIVLNFIAETKKELVEKIIFISKALVLPELPVKKDEDGYDIEDEEYKRKIFVSVIERDLTAVIFPICDLAYWYKN